MAASCPALLVISRHGPYEGQLARSALELALATAAFDRPVALLLLGNGVRQLQSGQRPPPGQKNHAKMIASMPLYDIQTVYVDAAAMDRHGIASTLDGLRLEFLNKQGIRDLCDNFEQVLTL